MRLIEKLLCRKKKLPFIAKYRMSLEREFKIGEKAILCHDFTEIHNRVQKSIDKQLKQYNNNDKYGVNK
ncbi:MAG: hypothetical protein J6Q15_01175 [Clostridia bacterium]|nr:hypothetical protein [Clostridia bacterium]